jgi:[acyl-carrier-protein] S-malonyltransferase
MNEAKERFAVELEKTPFKNPAFPVLPNSVGRFESDPQKIKDSLKEQMTSPVRFTATIKTLAEDGFFEFVECWPKPYLGPMIRKSLPPDGPKAVVRPALR